MLGGVDPSCWRGFPTLFPLDFLAISPERRPDRPRFPSTPRGSAPGAVAAEEAGTDVEVGVDAEAAPMAGTPIAGTATGVPSRSLCFVLLGNVF